MGKCIDTTEGSASVEEDKIFVAVGNVVNESFSTLLWALKSFRRKNFCIVHVHQPAQKIRVMGVKFRAELLDAEQVKAHREIEKKKVQDILNEYVDVCFHAGIDAETIYIEMDNIERGIVELIAQYGITKLVMGAAANKHYPKKMEELRSKKAIFVCQNAPISCHIWFVCKEHLIITREGVSEKIARQATTTPPSPLDTPTSLTSQPVRSRDRSEEKSLSHDGGPRNLVKGLFQPLRSTGNNSTGTSQPPCVFTQLSEDLRSEVLAKPQKRIDRLTNPVLDLVLRTISGSRETSEESTGASSSSSGGTAGIPIARCHSQNPDHSPRLSISSSEPFGESVENINDPSPTNDELAVVEPEIVRKEKKGREEKHDKERQELENLKSQLDQVMEELRIAQDQKVKLESQIADPDGMGTEFIQKKVLLAAEKLVAIKKELDDELRKLGKMKEEDFASLQRSQFFSVFSASEIESATQSFNPEMKLGEGGFGTVYKGHIRQTTVAVKRFNSNTLEGQSSSDFQLEVEVLSKVRHPNLVTLIGACPEASSLVFEYLSNGSLKDRLSCKEGTLFLGMLFVGLGWKGV